MRVLSINQIFQESGGTQRQFADRLGLSLQGAQKILYGVRQPGKALANLIGKSFGLVPVLISENEWGFIRSDALKRERARRARLRPELAAKVQAHLDGVA